MDCSTRYPILMVHGAGFRDMKHINYWGRIPQALEKRGAKLYYGHQDALGHVEHNAQVLKQNLLQILEETGCDKVNIIAHSKGGLDARCMISSLGMAEHVASLTTIGTPHHGSKTIDKLDVLPKWTVRAMSFFANVGVRIAGDTKPDFYTVSHSFSTQEAAAFNAENPNAPGVYYQSYAAAMKNAASDLIMLAPYLLVYWIEGESDGMVTPASAAWGEFRGVLRGATCRGVSHVDEVDMRRMNFTRKQREGRVSDIRQVYVGIAAQLKNMGF